MHHIREALKQAEIMAIIEDSFSMTDIIEIGDALLASPIFALEIAIDIPNALEILDALHHRADGHMLIGLGNVQTTTQMEMALMHKAHFISLSQFDLTLISQSLASGILALPQVSSLDEAKRAYLAGCHLLKFSPAIDLGASSLASLQQALANVAFIAVGGITLDNLADFVQAGAVGVGVGRYLISTPYQSMARLITQARALRKAWRNQVMISAST